MTSGNVSDEPIAYDDDDALERLAGDRRPRSSSTTARSTRAPTTRWCARSRAPAAAAAPLARATCPTRSRCRARRAPLLACGAELKSTFCVAKGGRAWVGHHIGDLENCETLRPTTRASSTSSGCSRSRPRSSPTTCTPTTSRRATRSAREGVELVAVQHHHAHLAACLAEHGETGPAVGAIFDGTGYGRRRHASGAASCSSATCAASSAPATCGPVRAARRRPRGPRAVADGVRVAARGASWPPGRAAPALDAASGEQVAELVPRPGSRRRGRRARGGSSTRSRRSAACAPGHLRGAGGDRARGRGRPGRARRLRDAGDDATVVLDARAAIAGRRRGPRRGRRDAGVVAARFHDALAGATARPARAAPSARPRTSCSRAACSRTGCCSSAPRARSSARRPARARPGACRPTTAASPSGRPRSRGVRLAPRELVVKP